MISLSIERKRFDSRLLFEQFELQLKAGELLCLLGPSGCGKTTLLNMIAGLDSRFEGQLRCRRLLNEWRSNGEQDQLAESVEPVVSYMFQQPRLLPWRTVRHNLELVAEPQRRAQITPLLASMGLVDCVDQYPNRLSLGMARRVALARALINEPQLLLMDEPFVSLDPQSAAQMQQLLQQIRARHPSTSILLVTHDLREAIGLADRILVLGGSPTRVVGQWQADRPQALRDWEYQREQERYLLSCYPNQLPEAESA